MTTRRPYPDGLADRMAELAAVERQLTAKTVGDDILRGASIGNDRRPAGDALMVIGQIKYQMDPDDPAALFLLVAAAFRPTDDQMDVVWHRSFDDRYQAILNAHGLTDDGQLRDRTEPAELVALYAEYDREYGRRFAACLREAGASDLADRYLEDEDAFWRDWKASADEMTERLRSTTGAPGLPK